MMTNEEIDYWHSYPDMGQIYAKLLHGSMLFLLSDDNRQSKYEVCIYRNDTH